MYFIFVRLFVDTKFFFYIYSIIICVKEIFILISTKEIEKENDCNNE